MKLIFIADFFIEDIIGGGELNNEEAILLLKENNEVLKIRSHEVNVKFLEENKDNKFIIANFINLNKDCREYLSKTCSYLVYEHDHKYLKSRNPAMYKNFIAPKDEIVNYEFYKNAKAILSQSNFHKNIIESNLKLGNIISLSGNLWSLQTLEKIKKFSKKNKLDACSIMNSTTPHKNVLGAVKYCESNNKPFKIIEPCAYYSFLDKLSDNNTFVFFPKTPETLSRVVVEARMMDMKVITNSLVGAAKEDWFKLKGTDLIDKMCEKRSFIVKKIEDILYHDKYVK